ncbi:hypothetical protein A3H89_02100 [Candidatus Amesbacteria bacterium RIFCSPLOWO2_02_FULL_48_11]|uniref:Uncharacterized protein n=2 Tax=Candidatus Amesiibacteriota TaxID=1752730 RepID=A0A1F4ZYB2_9BACT|nr:MAG: hypothetical protein UY33_C0008G0010 [Candidatus Amesbacteria bacterium GW2011_GWA1_48_9]OGC95172.1 MAG: hypothetical protein A3C34_01450 [Candidatus Amesbacteria bacterium RIFCSPHIGHO2_02_FULL_48_21]OGC97011.1 MAG: hypothetical protein A2W16_00600 [Candidatus Amesbacteria bacterium RBG_16_48_31]OGC99085.1 MAG: hypothetical protein A2702_02100 [Candidatus Amesbacteria bacterium RIFCSPHIGHO2_01_FULL_48_75]OGD02509.1 MAG: hypothetical protein A2354_04515 [Candidatus Amesbacteria bacterium
MKKYLVIVTFLLAITVGGFVFYKSFQTKELSSGNSKPIPFSLVIFEKNEGWGPCPPGGGPCSQSTKLYGSGRLVFEGNENGEKNLSKNLVDQVIGQIKQSGIMDNSCEAPIVLDYSAIYKVNLDGQEKTIRFPGCENEIKKIESLFLEN